MTDPVSLFVSIGTQLKAATHIAVGLSKLHTMAEVNAKASELQGANDLWIGSSWRRLATPPPG